MSGLLGVALADRVAGLEQRQGLRVLGDEYVAQVLRQTRHKMRSIETMGEDVVEKQQRSRDVMAERCVHELEIVVRIEDIEHRDSLLVRDGCTAEGDELVEDREGVTHTAVCLLRNDVEGILGDGDAFFGRHGLQIRDGIRHGDAVEIIDLATAEDGRQDLMFLRRSEDEDCV